MGRAQPPGSSSFSAATVTTPLFCTTLSPSVAWSRRSATWSHDQFASLQLPLTRQPSPALMVLATDLVLIRPVWYESHAEPMAFGGRS